ncbi:cell division cycle-associated protein 2 isoform X1 [Seriola aureovittata]|uniref:cell division cycle-associated protein 2 isoform X1 n=1 Tax=Seriola aureovittata TaxID=2871759 RepID=UPI0024BDB4CB|nr:cell division cycle-associated protein 2 isoform X1 [Seriola aureovittata]
MATVELNTTGTEGDQKEKMLSPSEEDSPAVLNGTSAPLNFSELTPCQFGISVQSFTPAVSSNHKDKSRLAQIKARRRSSIGVRGSPETNSLIRFMAQQRMKTPPTHLTPERVRSSPFPPRVASTLRQKMASFQSLMDVEESEVCDPMPMQDRNIGGCIKTRDYLSDESSIDGGKENHPPMMTPTTKKRRCLGPLEACEVQIREASAPILHFSLKEQEEADEPVTQILTQRPLPSKETVEEAQAVLISPALHDDFEGCSPTKKQQDGAFELQSPSQPPPDDPAVASPAHPASPVYIPSVPSLLETKPTGQDDSTGMSSVKNKKRVRFGGPLSPEFFDKNLPPSTPLQKGGTPARAPTPGQGLQLRSLLKTPQRSESQTPQAQPDLSSPTMFGASPTLAMPRRCRMQLVGEDSEETSGKIVFPSMEEIDSAVTSGAEYMWDSRPLNLNTAFHEEAISLRETESEIKPSTTSIMDVLDEPASLPENEKQPEAPAPVPARSSNRRKKQPEPEHESTSEAPARSSSRKRKQPEENEPAKRSTRSAAKSAAGKMKVTSTAARRWNRDVDRSLYGSREYASKNPTLSPITEKLSFISQSAQQTPSMSCTEHEAKNPETQMNPEMDNDTQMTGDLTVTHALENPLENSVTCPNSGTESTTGRGRRLSGQRVRGRRLKRKVSVGDCDLLREEPQDQTEGKTEEHCEDQTTTKLEASRETQLNHTVPEQGGVAIELNASTPSTDSDRKSECHAGLNVCPSPGEELDYTLNLPAEVTKRKAKQGRRSSVNSPALQEQGDQMEEHQKSHEVEQNGQGDQAMSYHENNSRLSSNSQGEEGVAHLDLAPWQADFNFEDVFKPVATRGQRSVRRSLRNQSNSNSSAGLAWLPRTSPDSGKEARRRTRGRRVSAAPPAQPSVSEETQADAS